MNAIDTNVLVRYIVQDDALQASLATKLIESFDEKNPVLINHLVLCETLWVLTYTYKYTREELVPLLKQILSTSNFEIPQTSLVWKAIYNYESGTADFSDCLICQTNSHLGASTTWTFDKNASKHDLFQLLK